MSMGIPVVRMTIEGMEHSILHALTEYELVRDEQIKLAVKEMCKPENIARVIGDAVARTTERVINEEIEAYFRHGEGRKKIREALKESIKAGEEFDDQFRTLG